MSSNPVAAVQQQVVRVRRRLFVQTLLDRLAWCWAGALLVAAVWFLVQPFISGGIDEALRWPAAGGLAAAATLLAILLAWKQAPADLAVALAVDERLGLQERITTSLTLSPAQVRSPAGQALLADAHARLNPLDVKSRFPLRLSRSALLVPATGLALALIALLYDPNLGSASDRRRADSQSLADVKDAEMKLKEVRKRAPKDWPKEEADREKLKEIQAAWDKLMEKQIDLNDKEKVREKVQAIRNLEEKVKDRMQDLKAQAEKGQHLKDQLKKLAALDPKDQKPQAKDGPAKDAEDALAKAELNKAQQELEALRKKLDDNKLNAEEQKQLQQQMQDLQEKVQRLADAEQKALKEQLQRLREQGELDDEQLKQAMDQLEQEGADLNELAEMLDDIQKCLKKGNCKGASAKLKRIIGKLKDIELTDEELRDLEENGQQLAELRELLLQQMNGNGMGGGGPPGGQRPIAKDSKTKSVDARQKARVDPTGQLKVTGFSRGGTFSKIDAKEVQGAFRQAVQDSPEAIERQRVSPEAAEMLRGYYENLGGQRKR